MTAVVQRVPIIVETTSLRGRALIPVLVFIGTLVAVVSSLGAPLVPTIATDYGVSLATAQWSLTITLLVGAATTPVIGRLGDGPRRLPVLLAALAILVLGSIVVAVPSGIFVRLLIGRGMQGVGLALLPLVMGIARDHLDPDRARSTLATLSVTAIVGVGLGYPATGFLTEHLSFEAGFWLAAALGLIAMTLAALVVPTSAHRLRQPFDYPGAFLLVLGLTGLLISISQGQSWGWVSWRLLALAVISLACIGCWIWYELRIELPMVDLRLLRDQTVLTANVTAVLAGIAMYLLMSMIIRYVQTPMTISYGLGASVVIGGLVLLPMSAASFFSTKLLSYLSRWVSPGQVLPLGLFAFALSLLLFATRRSHLWEILLAMAFGGIGIGCSFAVMPRMIVSAARPEDTSSALALNQVLRTIGYSVGSALAATILAAHTLPASEFPTDSGYTVGALVGIVLCVATGILSMILQPANRLRGALLDATRLSTARLSTARELVVTESVDPAIAEVLAFEPARGQSATSSSAVRSNSTISKNQYSDRAVHP